MIDEFLIEFSTNLDGNIEEFNHEATNYHASIVRFIYNYLNLLNLSDYSEIQRTRFHNLFSFIENAMEKIINVSEATSKIKIISPKIREYLKKIFKMFIDNLRIIQEDNISTKEIEGLTKRRFDLLKKIETEKFDHQEHAIIRECRIMFDILNDLIQVYFALNMEKYISKNNLSI